MSKPDISGYRNFEDITARLDEIVGLVKNKDTSLERSLDLFDEAIALGSKAVEIVDSTDFSKEEKEQLRQSEEAATASARASSGPAAQENSHKAVSDPADHEPVKKDGQSSDSSRVS